MTPRSAASAWAKFATSDCAQVVPGKTAKDNGTCKIVEGTINPHGHCIAFTPKPKPNSKPKPKK